MALTPIERYVPPTVHAAWCLDVDPDFPGQPHSKVPAHLCEAYAQVWELQWSLTPGAPAPLGTAFTYGALAGILEALRRTLVVWTATLTDPRDVQAAEQATTWVQAARWALDGHPALAGGTVRVP